ncbi:hypothetical protein [Actinoplanes sp. NPDC049118]|uniref:hypothetical protein n=1 Tax=Actinoplanes sp. NPDC049118 TaxID=3155769 RepID=UPI0033C4293E
MERLMDRPAWERGSGKAHRKLLDALTEALRTRNCRLQHVKWFGAGRSGHPVAGIIRHEGGPNYRILKFSTDLQHQRMLDALQVKNTFVARHLAEVEHERIPLGGNECAVFMRIADDDVVDIVSMEELRAQGRAIDYGVIVRAVISEWNDDEPTVVNRSARFVVGGIVGRRRGPVLRWIRAASHLDDFAPVSLLAGEAGRQIVQSLLLGNAHGDLSSRNILIPADPGVRSDDFHLIDYDHFARNAPLARDPMHLLVGLALDVFADHAAMRGEIIKAIVNPDDPSIAAQAGDFTRVSAAIHDACAAGITRTRGFSRYLREQCLLALVGVALRHVGRDRKVDDPEEVKRWCYDLAVAAAHRFEKVRQRYEDPPRISPDPDGPTPTIVDRHLEREDLTHRLAYGPHGVVSVEGKRGIGKTKLIDVVLHDMAGHHDGHRLRAERHHASASRNLDLRTLVELISARSAPAVRGSPLVLLESTLRKLRDTPVVVTVAEAQNLLEPGTHRIADPDLADAFDMLSTEPDHRVSVVLETEHGAVLPVAEAWPDNEPVVVPRMAETDFLSMLRDMDRGMSQQVDDLSEAERRTLWESAGGNPRVAELVCASVCLHPVMTLPELVADLHRNRKKPAAYLIKRLLGGMPKTSVRTMRALAALRTPLPATIIAQLVHGAGSASAVRQSLDNLSDRRVIGQQGEFYFLSPADAATVLRFVRQPRRSKLHYAAADILSSYRECRPAPRRVDDLRYHLAEVDCLIASGDHGSACDVMAEINEYVVEWNCAGLLRGRREKIRGLLDTERQELHNEDALGGIYVDLGKLDRASEAYDRAQRLAGPDTPPKVMARLHANIADMHWAANDMDRAQRSNEKALAQATEAGDRVAMMKSLIGLADGDRRRGEFTAAIARAGEVLGADDLATLVARNRTARVQAVSAAVRLSRWHAERDGPDDLGEARRWLARADDLAGRGKDWHRAAYLDALADLRLAEGLADGDVEEAMAAARRAVGLAYRVQDQAILLQSRTTLCVAQLRRGRYPQAAQEIRRAVRHRPEGRHLVVPALLALTTRLTGDHKAAARHFKGLRADAARRIKGETGAPTDFGARHFHGFAECGLVLDGHGSMKSAKRSLGVADLRHRPPAPGLIARMVFLVQKLDESGPRPGMLQPAIDALQGA